MIDPHAGIVPEHVAHVPPFEPQALVDVPARHAPPLTQPEQEVQVPLSQIIPEPQLVPFATAVPWSTQASVPIEQLVSPLSHGLDGVHATPALHETQLPAEQTRFVPHAVPFARSFPWSAHVCEPEEQSVRPVWQGFAGVHDAPAVHAVHAPLSQTMLPPHDAPLPTGLLVSVQTAEPVLQLVEPT